MERLENQRRVIAALMIRTLMGKYGRDGLGFLWFIIQPMFLVAGIVVVWMFIFPSGKHGLNLFTFVLGSYVPLTLWRHLSGIPFLMKMNVGLLYFRRITIFDIILAYMLTETLVISAAGIATYLIFLSFDLVGPVQDPAMLLLGWMMMCWFGFGAGCLTAGLSEKYEVVGHLVPPMQYLTLPISGVFFMVAWLPPTARDHALLVPLVHIYEMIRAGLFGDAVRTYYSVPYVTVFAIVQTALGVWAVSSARARLRTR